MSAPFFHLSIVLQHHAQGQLSATRKFCCLVTTLVQLTVSISPNKQRTVKGFCDLRAELRKSSQCLVSRGLLQGSWKCFVCILKRLKSSSHVDRNDNILHLADVNQWEALKTHLWDTFCFFLSIFLNKSEHELYESRYWQWWSCLTPLSASITEVLPKSKPAWKTLCVGKMCKCNPQIII